MSKYIIVVDDDKEIREIVTFVLSRHDFEVAAASNGRQLQHLLLQQLPDLVILDIMMPGENGYQLFRSLRSDEHMTKPFHPFELVERVKALLQTTQH